MKNWNFINGWSLKSVLVNSASCLMFMNLFMLSNISLAKDENAPNMELLEFLGGGIKVGDEYLDPINYSDIEHKAVMEETNNPSAKSSSSKREEGGENE